jgi:hypothetical protein
VVIRSFSSVCLALTSSIGSAAASAELIASPVRSFVTCSRKDGLSNCSSAIASSITSISAALQLLPLCENAEEIPPSYGALASSPVSTLVGDGRDPGPCCSPWTFGERHLLPTVLIQRKDARPSWARVACWGSSRPWPNVAKRSDRGRFTNCLGTWGRSSPLWFEQPQKSAGKWEY